MERENSNSAVEKPGIYHPTTQIKVNITNGKPCYSHVSDTAWGEELFTCMLFFLEMGTVQVNHNKDTK